MLTQTYPKSYNWEILTYIGLTSLIALLVWLVGVSQSTAPYPHSAVLNKQFDYQRLPFEVRRTTVYDSPDSMQTVCRWYSTRYQLVANSPEWGCAALSREADVLGLHLLMNVSVSEVAWGSRVYVHQTLLWPDAYQRLKRYLPEVR